MVSGSTRESASASEITAACPATEGAVNPALSEPSLLTAEARITACTTSPSASASSIRFSTTTPTPLPSTVPPASASKARQWPSGERMPPSSHM
jgi:hypothetical protein